MAVDSYEIISEILKARKKSREEVSEALQTILTESHEVFSGIDSYQQKFVQKEVRQPDFYYKAQDELSGYYMYLSPIVMLLTALKEVRSNGYFHTTRVNFESKPKTERNEKGVEVVKKFVSSPVEKEAQEYVSEETYMAAIFLGYLEACRTAIQTCRNRTKQYEEEFRASK
jgi:hypothetical protein